MKPIILFRKNQYNKEEFLIAQKYFDVTESRIGLENRLVIPRYSSLPFHNELERDLVLQNSKLINSTYEHSYVSNFDYYFDLESYTPKTYFRLEDVSSSGPWVCKGKTNSLKSQFKAKMFAENRNDLINKYNDLLNDAFVGEQGIIIRDFVPLESFGKSLSGIDYANEWRFFFYKNQLLSYGYYWSNAEIIPKNEDLDPKAKDLAQEIASIVSERVNFFVVDLAKTNDGKWILIELNDGTMSGLSENDPEILYSNLRKCFNP